MEYWSKWLKSLFFLFFFFLMLTLFLAVDFTLKTVSSIVNMFQLLYFIKRMKQRKILLHINKIKMVYLLCCLRNTVLKEQKLLTSVLELTSKGTLVVSTVSQIQNRPMQQRTMFPTEVPFCGQQNLPLKDQVGNRQLLLSL